MLPHVVLPDQFPQYPQGYYPFEESPAKIPPKVRKPPYLQTQVHCPGGLHMKTDICFMLLLTTCIWVFLQGSRVQPRNRLWTTCVATWIKDTFPSTPSARMSEGCLTLLTWWRPKHWSTLARLCLFSKPMTLYLRLQNMKTTTYPITRRFSTPSPARECIFSKLRHSDTNIE